MHTKHIIDQIEDYIDNQLSSEARQRFEKHVASCPECAHRLFNAQRLTVELGPVMKSVLGQPKLPPHLHQQIRSQLDQSHKKRSSFWGWFNWEMPGRVLNAAGTIAVIALLIFAVFTTIQSQQSEDRQEQFRTTMMASSAEPAVSPTPVAALKSTTLGDTVPLASLTPTVVTKPKIMVRPHVQIEAPKKIATASTPRPAKESVIPAPPEGIIAFANFNPAPHKQFFETHFIHPDGTGHEIFSLAGVSEPALRASQSGHQIAYRAWGQSTSPRRSLTSNTLAGEEPIPITDFWEDAQPDWSPKENRIIFASNRESDRRWRLYTAWGDGSLEENLEREGKSPTFAPDGFRFAFEGCDETGKQCGLWVTDLNNSKNEVKFFLQNHQAKSPDWSPVNEQIAYMAELDNNWDIYLTNSKGEYMRRLTHHSAIDGLPAWSPDGKWLAFLSDRGENWGIWLLHLKSGHLKQLYKFEGEGIFTPETPLYGERNWWDEQISWSR